MNEIEKENNNGRAIQRHCRYLITDEFSAASHYGDQNIAHNGNTQYDLHLIRPRLQYLMVESHFQGFSNILRCAINYWSNYQTKFIVN
jgi:hypothetical protein